MNVLIIPEDFRHDQYLLKPLFQSLFQKHFNRPRAKVVVCRDPNLGGVGEALKLERIQDIVARYQYRTDIFVLCLDRDGDTSRRKTLNEIEEHIANSGSFIFLAENAWEEVETWTLAGLELPTWSWSDIRQEIHVKEVYFEPLVADRGLQASPGRGRKALGAEAAHRLDRILRLCTEDFGALTQRLANELSLP